MRFSRRGPQAGPADVIEPSLGLGRSGGVEAAMV
jgi:hypothetical protein